MSESHPCARHGRQLRKGVGFQAPDDQQGRVECWIGATRAKRIALPDQSKRTPPRVMDPTRACAPLGASVRRGNPNLRRFQTANRGHARFARVALAVSLALARFAARPFWGADSSCGHGANSTALDACVPPPPSHVEPHKNGLRSLLVMLASTSVRSEDLGATRERREKRCPRNSRAVCSRAN